MGSLKLSQETGTSGAINLSRRRDTHNLKITESLRYWPTNPTNCFLLNELIDFFPSWKEIRFPSKI